MMSEKRFVEDHSYLVHYDNCIFDKVQHKHLYLDEVIDLLNEQQSIIDEQKIAIDEMITDYKNLEKGNEQLQKEKEYYREYALQYLLGYEFYSDNFLNTIKNTISEEEVKRIKEEENKIIEALKKEGLYE